MIAEEPAAGAGEADAAGLGLPVLARYGGDVLWIACGLIGIPLSIGMAVLARKMRAPVENP